MRPEGLYARIAAFTRLFARTYSTPMTQILLIRHAVNDFVRTGRLAGWTPEVHLNEEGIAQAAALGERLATWSIDHIYASPLERTMETAAAIQQHHPHLTVQPYEAVGEVRYGDWQGQSISALQHRKMWQLVQQYPSRAVFPNGEAMRDVQARGVNAIETLVAAHPRQTLVIVSHADIIKMVMAHYLGMHLDEFQRIVIAPSSISTLSLGFGRPYVGSLNDTAHLATLEKARTSAKQGAPGR